MSFKKIITIICALALIAVVAIGSTLAYFHDEDSKLNAFWAAGDPDNPDENSGFDVEFDEPGWDEDNANDLTPGDVVVKDPTITNLKDDSYVRMIITIQDKEGNVITDMTRADKIFSMIYYSDPAQTEKMDSIALAALCRTNEDLFTLDAARTTAAGTGIYCFNYSANDGILSNAETAVLFSGVIVPTDWDQDDIAEIGNFDILVTAQSIQAKNFNDAAEAFTALDTYN